VNNINKESALASSPEISQNWIKRSQEERISLVQEELKKNKECSDFVVTEAAENGQITLLIERTISAGVRGLMLLDLEQALKDSIDKGITVWLVPVGDKSKLRNLRGIQIKPEI
tara:strand:+ start:24 stop:365 length:342 start_codon:yes stop_codon:yes gene_type:complete